MWQIVFRENSVMSARLTKSVILREYRFLASTDTKIFAMGRETDPGLTQDEGINRVASWLSG
jgi:hypothetical protein